jgi:spermidine synthase
VAGRLYAVSTIGSLLGTFLSALVAIPLIGTQRTLLASAALLAFAGSTLLGVRWLALAAALGALLVLPPGAIKASEGVLHEDESLYQFVQVTERDGARRLYLDEGVAVHSIWRPGEVLTGGVWDTFLALPPLLDRPLERVAILGNAGGTTARAMGVYYPQAEIDGVELDPAVTDAGRRYLGLDDNPRLKVHTADARPFLRRSDGGYDLIVVDAYRPPYVPFYLATREFFELVRERLAPDGMVALNVASVPGDTRLPRAIATTLSRELPAVWTWQALRFNQIVVGLMQPLEGEEIRRRLREVEGDLAPLTELAARDLRPASTSGDAWTDDHAPVEWITDRMIIEYAAEGGRLDEAPLPTEP